MGEHEVVPAFDILLDEIDEVVVGLNKKGAQLLTAGKYEEARAVIEKVEAINAIREKVEALSEDWCKLSIKSSKKRERKPRKRKPKSTARLKKGLRTPEDSFKLPLLKTLIDMGGAGKVSDVLDHMEEYVKPILTEHDYEILKSSNELRWRNTAKWARQDLVNEGLLDKDSPYGIWTITDQGRAWAQSHSQDSLTQNHPDKHKDVAISERQNAQTDRSVALEQIIEVCIEIYHNGRDYNEAVKWVADRRGLKSIHTVYDKCTRQLGLTTAEFKDLAEDKFTLMKLLIDQFPEDQYYIIKQLGS